MLVLSRKKSQTIRIGNDIKITVESIGPNTVRIGIDAPKRVPICRGELSAVALAGIIHKAKAGPVPGGQSESSKGPESCEPTTDRNGRGT